MNLDSQTELGRYIAIEGMDGAGKTTQAQMLYDRQLSLGRQSLLTRAPGGTEIGIHLRNIFKNNAVKRLTESNVALAMIDHHETRDQIIEPMTQMGIDVITDRTWMSTMAYQGFGEGHDRSDIFTRSAKALGKFVFPNVAVIIDIPLEASEARVRSRGNEANDYFEQKGRPFFARVREGYLNIAEKYDITVVDGGTSPENVHQTICKIVDAS